MKKIFLFPGQGSQYVGMGKSLVENFTAAKRTFEEASDSIGFDLAKVCFEGPESDLKLTHITQPAILTHSVAAYRSFAAESEMRPDFVAGHSLGEYSALVCAEALPFSEAVRLVHHRGRFMQEAVPVGTGAMAALVGAQENSVSSLCERASHSTGKICEMANFNGGGQIVISGHREAVEEALRLAAADPAYGIAKAVALPVSAPFHCSLMKKAEEQMATLLAKIEFKNLSCSYIANVDAKVYSSAAGVGERLVKQVCGAVRWEQSMGLLPDLGVGYAFEMGPGRVLAGLMRRISREIKVKGLDQAGDLQGLLS